LFPTIIAFPEVNPESPLSLIASLTPFKHTTTVYNELLPIFDTQASFQDHFTPTLKVPVKLPAPTTNLDASGRCEEPETLSVPLIDWFTKYFPSQSPLYYLKDFHYTPHLPIITPPLFASMDVLNPFLRAANMGDYDFLYHGPANSTTPIHTDVLFSHSYSYNVTGIKEWTFYDTIPSDSTTASDSTTGTRQITTTQHPGEVMFVPSGLAHSVVNQTAAISLNRNWITPSVLPRTLATLLTEVAAVDEEIEKWGMVLDAAEREEMLRGCCGLNVGMFFAMTLMAIQQRYPTITDPATAQDFATLVDVLGAVKDEAARICSLLTNGRAALAQADVYIDITEKLRS